MSIIVRLLLVLQITSLLPLGVMVLIELPLWLSVVLGVLHAVMLCSAYLYHGGLESKLTAGLTLVAATAAALTGSWLLVVWITLLVAISYARLLAQTNLWWRIVETLVVLQLLLLLFFGLLPSLLPEAIGANLITRVDYLILACWVGTIGFVMIASSKRRLGFEIITVVMFFLITLLLVLSVAVMAQQRLLPYGLTVLTVLLFGGLIATVFWIAWSPVLGGGLSTVFFRHVLSQGVPVDEWLSNMEQLAEEKGQAKDFWQGAMELLYSKMPLEGISWKSVEGKGKLVGKRTTNQIDLPLREDSVTAYSKNRWLPTRIFNLWMLARVANEFHYAKRREERRSAEAAIKSVYEVGAKTIHDIKNLLHIIKLIVESDSEKSAQRLIPRLGDLSTRLEHSLNQLANPQTQQVGGTVMAAKTWWSGIAERHRNNKIDFKPLPHQVAEVELQLDLFDRAFENLLLNALKKRIKEPAIQISVELGAGPRLSVTDTGSPVVASQLEKLFSSPVPSTDGMGIGLFQLAAAATKAGWELHLSSNQLGKVEFVLELQRCVQKSD